MIRLVVAALAIVCAVPAAQARVQKPVLVIERAGNCVEPTEVMRREHRKLLLQQRERTVRLGVRTRAHSLAGCVECHASSKTGSVLGPEGFCQSCHDYAGVKADCFGCHSPKPAGARR